MSLPHFAGVNTLHAERRKEVLHFFVHFARPQMPELNRQAAPQPPEHVDAHPGIGEVSDSTATNDNAFASVAARIFRYRSDEPFARHPGIVQRQRLIIVGILCRGEDPSVCLLALARRKVIQGSSLIVEVDATNDLFGRDHVHAPRQSIDRIHAQVIWPVASVSVAQRHCPVFPTPALRAAA